MRRGLGVALKFSPSFYLNSASSLRSPVKQSLHGGVQSARCILFILPKIININTSLANNLQAVDTRYIWFKNIPLELEYWMFVYFDTSDERILSILLITVYVETVCSAEWSVSLCLLNIFALTNDCHNVVRFHIPRHIAASWEPGYWVTTLGLGWRRPSVTRPPVAVCTVTQYLTSYTDCTPRPAA